MEEKGQSQHYCGHSQPPAGHRSTLWDAVIYAVEHNGSAAAADDLQQLIKLTRKHAAADAGASSLLWDDLIDKCVDAGMFGAIVAAAEGVEDYDVDWATVLAAAAPEGNIDVVRVIAQKGGLRSSALLFLTGLKAAVDAGRMDALQLIGEAMARAPSDGPEWGQALAAAARSGSLAVLQSVAGWAGGKAAWGEALRVALELKEGPVFQYIFEAAVVAAAAGDDTVTASQWSAALTAAVREARTDLAKGVLRAVERRGMGVQMRWEDALLAATAELPKSNLFQLILGSAESAGGSHIDWGKLLCHVVWLTGSRQAALREVLDAARERWPSEARRRKSMQNALAKAFSFSNAAAVGMLLDEEPSLLDEQLFYGGVRTLLQEAAAEARCDTLQAVLPKCTQAQLNGYSWAGLTPLQLACRRWRRSIKRSHKQCAEKAAVMLISEGADLDDGDGADTLPPAAKEAWHLRMAAGSVIVHGQRQEQGQQHHPEKQQQEEQQRRQEEQQRQQPAQEALARQLPQSPSSQPPPLQQPPSQQAPLVQTNQHQQEEGAHVGWVGEDMGADDQRRAQEHQQQQPDPMPRPPHKGSNSAAAGSGQGSQRPLGLMAVPEVKVEAIGASATYLQLAQQPFDASELARLRAHYLEPYVIKVRVDSATRSGALRWVEKQRPCKPRLQQYYSEQLWQRVERLACSGDAGDSRSSGVDAAAAQLLWWLRCIQQYERVCHKERMPPVLQRFMAGSGRDGIASGGEVTEVETVDLVSDEEDVDEVEAWLMANGGCVVVGEKQAPVRTVGAAPSAVAVEVKVEPEDVEEDAA